MRAVPATVEAPAEAETACGGRTTTWTAIAVVWIAVRRVAAGGIGGGERPPERAEAAEAEAREHPALAVGVRLVTGEGPPWTVSALRPNARPGRVVLSLDRLF